ncbi:hypothetical protein KEM52_003707 [Ascosphaera acerosa]|nr:hypothetical protein KEM52_003707 [Ascosphaera acerosa]
MAFRFNFASDDIDPDEEEEEQRVSSGLGDLTLEDDADAPQLQPARRLPLDELLAALPSTLYYNLLDITPLSESLGDSSPNTASDDADQAAQPLVTVPRREIFDIRAQLMAEVDLTAETREEEESKTLIRGLEKGDLDPRVYEGGFKTWECAVDLARLILRDEVDDLFDDSDAQSTTVVEPAHHSPRRHKSDEDLELDITAELLASFRQDLRRRNITLSFISGAWSRDFVDLVLAPPLRDAAKATSTDESQSAQQSPPNESTRRGRLLILASETIYSPAALRPFSETLASLLTSRKDAAGAAIKGTKVARALIAAKRVYFGIGGGIDEFRDVMQDVQHKEGCDFVFEERLDVDDVGVGRTIVEIHRMLRKSVVGIQSDLVKYESTSYYLLNMNSELLHIVTIAPCAKLQAADSLFRLESQAADAKN